MLRLVLLFVCLLTFENYNHACAHFLFVHMVRGKTPRAELHFAESAWDFSANGRMVGIMVAAEARGPGNEKMTCTQESFGLVAPVNENQTAACADFTYGLMSRGETFLLEYHAKGIVGLESANTPIGLKAEVLAAPTDSDRLVLTVLFEGIPASGAEVVASVKGLDAETFTADKNGQVEIPRPTTPVFSIRAMVSEKREGTYENRPYGEARHYTTLTVHTQDVPSNSDGLAWAVLHDARDRCAEFTANGTQWSGKFKGKFDDESSKGSFVSTNGDVQISETDPDSTATQNSLDLLNLLPNPYSFSEAVVFNTDRSARGGSVITIPDRGLEFEIQDRRIQSIHQNHDGVHRRVDVLEWSTTEDERILPERTVVTTFENDGSIKNVTILKHVHTEENGVYVPQCSGVQTTGADTTIPVSVTVSDAVVD